MGATGIQHYRTRKNLSQATLAQELAIPPGAMSQIETGILIPTAEQVDKLVALLGVPPTYLFSRHILDEVAERARAPKGAA